MIDAIVVGTTLAVMGAMMVLTWGILFWPTDAEMYYLPAAVQLPKLQFISQIHSGMDSEFVKWLHGKEIFIVLISWAQRLMRDTETLRPLITVCVLAVTGSAMLIYEIARRYWGRMTGVICWLLFITSAWPYLYILFIKHQPIGLLFFLCSVFCLQRAFIPKWNSFFNFFAGLFLGLSVYSSSSAALYVPYWLAALVVSCWSEERRFRKKLLALLMNLVGVITVIVTVNFPDIAGNIREYFQYVEISKSYNHFYHNQPVLIQWIAHPEQGVRGGWLWVWRYFHLIMPVLFPMYILSVGVLVAGVLRPPQNFRRVAVALFMVVLSFSSPILAEIKGVAQYGANYFTVLVGMIMFLGYTFHQILEKTWWKSMPDLSRRTLMIVSVLMMAAHIIWNAVLFWGDLYPTRMGISYLSSAIRKLKIEKIGTYLRHPYESYVLRPLDPALLKTLRFIPLSNIYTPWDGYVLVPPVLGSTIFRPVHGAYSDFDKDIFVNTLIGKGNIADYAVASFPTLASSRIWPHEEEILSYRYLILNQFPEKAWEKGKVWLLDSARLRRDIQKNMPSPEFILLASQNIRNIGARSPVYRYEGVVFILPRAAKLSSWPAEITKVGNPSDALRAYIYKADKNGVWTPAGEGFVSRPLGADHIPPGIPHSDVDFLFAETLQLSPGGYRVVIYRTGPADDQNYFRIRNDDPTTVIKKILNNHLPGVQEDLPEGL